MNGSVYQVGKFWRYQFDAGPDPATGKRRRPSGSGFKTKREATKAMHAAMHAIEAGAPMVGELSTLSSYVTDEWLPGRRGALRPSTFASYTDVLTGRVLPRIGALQLDQITPKHVADLVHDLGVDGGRDARRGPGLSSRSVRYTLTVLTRVLGDAMKAGLVSRNVAELVERPKVWKKEMRWWGVNDARRFLTHVDGDRLEALWTLLLTTGLRRGEALGLKWDDVDLDAGRLAVRRALVATGYQVRFSEPKTAASTRVVSLDPGTVAALRQHRTRQLEERMALGAGYMDDDIVFAAVSGEVLRPDFVSKRFDRLVKAAGVPRIRLHDLRHTCATTLLEQGVPLKVVTERLGHSSTRITSDLYQHVGETMQDEAAAKLGAAFLERNSP